MEPLVSIVIPIYNGEKYIESCISSLLNQTHQNLEVILVDDGSQDQSVKVCQQYAQTDNRIKVFCQKNSGVSAARNVGIKHATGKYIMFFDVDDTVEPNVVEDNVKLAEENQADVVMFCFWYYIVDEKRLKENSMEQIFVGSAKEYFDKMLIPTIDNEVFNAPWNKLVRRQLLEDNNLGFDERYTIYEDTIFASELLNIAEKIVVNNKMYYKYFVRSSGNLLSSFCEKYYESVSQLHQNAMHYCSKYENNSKQMTRFHTFYTELVIMHLKQISCNAKLTKERKYQLIDRICNENEFIDALNNSKLGLKKKMMRFIINHKMTGVIYRIYTFRKHFE